MVGSFFTTLFAKIAAVITWFSDLFVAIFVSLWDILRDAATWFFEQGLTLASTAVGSLSLSGINANLNYGSIPSNVMLVMSCIGLGQALSIITAALVIRFTLQLIPFVRLGS
jgi:hypothetical protein